MKKIKVLHIQETMAAGGVERLRLSLARHLDKELFEQKFVSTNAGGNIPDEIRKEGWEVISIGTLKSSFQWSQHKRVQQLIQDFKPDIIHGAVFEGVTLTAVNGWLKRVPVIILEETSDPINRSWRANFLMKVFSSMADAVVGVSPSVSKEYLLDKLKIPGGKVFLINNGVALPRKVNIKEISSTKSKWGIEETDFVLGSVGRMHQESHKRFSDLIKAFAQFAAGKENVKLLVVGEGPLKANYIQEAQELRLQDKIIFTGYQADVSLFYSLMDVFALVSEREAFGLVLAEAMLNRLPVIATRVGGMKYIVVEDETGILVEARNIDKIAAAMDRLYTDKTLRQEMGKSGYERALKEYTEEVYVKKVENLYLDLYKRKVGPIPNNS